MKVTAVFIFLSLISTVASAHHGNSIFNMSEQTKVEGTIAAVLWRNPHILITVDSKNADGEDITLEIEGSSPNILKVGGANAQSLAVGDSVTAIVSLSRRRPESSAYGYEMIKSDGTVVPMVSSRLKRPENKQEANSIFGTWVTTADSFVSFVTSFPRWPLNEKAEALKSLHTPQASGQVRCVPVSSPMLMIYPVATVFEQGRDSITVKSEWLGAQRIIYTDGRAHPAITERFQQGHSIGHWEGDVLVVDTTNFTDQETSGIQSGASRHLIERFSLNEDGRSLNYEYALDDSEYLTDAVTGQGTMSYRPDLQFSDAECDLALAERYFNEQN